MYLLSPPRRRRCAAPGESHPQSPQPSPTSPPSTAAAAEDAAGLNPCGEAAAAALSSADGNARGGGARPFPLQRWCAAEIWRPRDLRRSSSAEDLDRGHGEIQSLGFGSIHRPRLVNFGNGKRRFPGTSSRHEDVRVFLARAWWWWLPSPPKVVGQAGGEFGGAAAGESWPFGGRWRRLDVVTLVKASS